MDIKQAASAYNSIAGIAQSQAEDATDSSSSSGGIATFETLLSNALGNAVDSGHKAEQVSKLALLGKADLTDLATAVSGAELALNTIVTIRDKAVSAYQAILQMPM